MNLPILTSSPPWYSDGLNFTCTQCGNCCSGPPGFVWIAPDEIVKLAQHLGLTPQETVERYCRKIGGQFSLREKPGVANQRDCIFLQDAPGGKRTCGVYAARPRQCRDWPFWPGNLTNKQSWDAAAVRCHGMNQGRHFSAEEIERYVAGMKS